MSHQLMPASARIPAMDVLRIAAISILVFYHHLMIYVPGWEFHFKDALETSWLAHVLLLTSPWRMGLLWLISGIALRFAIARTSSSMYLLYTRSLQLLFPLLTGLLLVVPPQLYIEMQQAGQMPLTYMEFWHALLFAQQDFFAEYQAGIWPAIDVNHLWFLRSLWQFSLVAILLSPLLTHRSALSIQAALSNRPVALFTVILLIIFTLDANTSGDTNRESIGAVWFFSGFLFGRLSGFWQALKVRVRSLLMLALISMAGVQLGYLFVWQQPTPIPWIKTLAMVAYDINRAALPLCCLAVAAIWMNRSFPTLHNTNRFVYPLYIIHQTVSIVVASVIASDIAPSSSATARLMLSLPVALLIDGAAIFVISRFSLLRFSFGMRLNLAHGHLRSIVSALALLAILPLAFAILL